MGNWSLAMLAASLLATAGVILMLYSGMSEFLYINAAAVIVFDLLAIIFGGIGGWAGKSKAGLVFGILYLVLLFVLIPVMVHK